MDKESSPLSKAQQFARDKMEGFSRAGRAIMYYGTAEIMHLGNPVITQRQIFPKPPMIGRQSGAFWEASWKMADGQRISLPELAERGVVRHKVEAIGKESMPQNCPLIVLANHPYDGDFEGYEALTAIAHYVATARQGGGERLDSQRNRRTTEPHEMQARTSENRVMRAIGIASFFHRAMIRSFGSIPVDRPGQDQKPPMEMGRILAGNGVLVMHPEGTMRDNLGDIDPRVRRLINNLATTAPKEPVQCTPVDRTSKLKDRIRFFGVCAYIDPKNRKVMVVKGSPITFSGEKEAAEEAMEQLAQNLPVHRRGRYT